MSTPPASSAVDLVVLGGYSADLDGHARGVTALTLAGSRPGQVRATTVGSVPLSSPSFVIKHRSQPWLFAVSESNPGAVASLTVAGDGSLALLSTRDTGSGGDCHLALTADGKHLVTAGYGSGTTSSFEVGPGGELSEQLDLFTFAGSGPDRERQQTPHAHQVVPDGTELLVCDLGTDQIHRLGLDDRGRFSRTAPPIKLPSGSGPRHLTLVEDHLVVACELSAEVWVARRGPGGWQEVGRVPASRTTAGECAPSAIVSQGRRVYVANRGPGTVTVLDLDPEQGDLTAVAEFGCGGPWPRDLALSDGRLWVANQGNDVVSVFSTSQLPPQAAEFEFSAPSPTCLVLLVRDA